MNSEIFTQESDSIRQKSNRKKTAATQPVSLRNWKPAPAPLGFIIQPPRGYGFYTDLVTSSAMLNVRPNFIPQLYS